MYYRGYFSGYFSVFGAAGIRVILIFIGVILFIALNAGLRLAGL